MAVYSHRRHWSSGQTDYDWECSLVHVQSSSARFYHQHVRKLGKQYWQSHVADILMATVCMCVRERERKETGRTLTGHLAVTRGHVSAGSAELLPPLAACKGPAPLPTVVCSDCFGCDI